MAGSILPSPYSPCTKVKIRFLQKGTNTISKSEEAGMNAQSLFLATLIALDFTLVSE